MTFTKLSEVKYSDTALTAIIPSMDVGTQRAVIWDFNISPDFSPTSDNRRIIRTVKIYLPSQGQYTIGSEVKSALKKPSVTNDSFEGEVTTVSGSGTTSNVSRGTIFVDGYVESVWQGNNRTTGVQFT